LFNESHANWKKDLEDYQFRRTHCGWNSKTLPKKTYVTHKKVKAKETSYHPILQVHRNSKKEKDNKEKEK